MKKMTALIAVAASVLAIAGIHFSAIGAGPTIASSSISPIVDIQPTTGLPGVTPDPLIFQKGEGPARIRWQIPAGSSLTFDDKVTGVEIVGELVYEKGVAKVKTDHNEFEPCEVESDFKAVICKNRHTRAGYYKYNLHLKQNGKSVTVDPSIMNG